MPEPVIHSAAGAVAAGGAVIPVAAAASGFFGIEYASIAWAFIGGVVYLIALKRMNSWVMACLSVFVSTSIGGAFGTWLAKPALLLLVEYVPTLKPWEPEALHPMMGLIALVVGIFIQAALPGLANRVGRISEGPHAL